MENSLRLKIFITAVLILSMISPAFAKKKKTKSTPTPVPTATSNQTAMLKALQFYVYEKSTDVVNDVTGIFDNKTQKVTVKCELKNLSAKEIHGVRGTLRFMTFFGEKIADIAIETQAAIPSGQVIGVNWNVPTDRLSADEFDKLKKTKLEQMKQVWYPTTIAFTDGTVLK